MELIELLFIFEVPVERKTNDGDLLFNFLYNFIIQIRNARIGSGNGQRYFQFHQHHPTGPFALAQFVPPKRILA